jgi:PAS domain S-box-containing protein
LNQSLIFLAHILQKGERMKRKHLGELLVEAGSISKEQLNHSLKEQKVSKEKLGQILVKLGYITEEVLFEFLCNQLGTSGIDLYKEVIDERAVEMIPRNIAEKYKVVPVGFKLEGETNKLTVAMANSPDPEKAVALIEFISGYSTAPIFASEIQLESIIRYYYPNIEAIGFYDELEQRNKDLEILTNLIQAVHKSPDLEEIYRVALDSVMELENVDMVMIYLVDEQRQEAVLQAHRNVPEDYMRRASSIPYPKGITWKVINTGSMLNVENAQKDPDIGPAGRDLGHHSILGIPIILEERAIGVIWFISYKEREFSESEVSLLSTLGNQIAIAISKAKTFKALLDSEGQYRTLIETARDVIFTLSTDETITSLNSSFETLTGWSRGEWLGKPFVSLVHPDDLPFTMELFQRALQGETPSIFELRILSKSGEYLIAEFTITLELRDGKVIHGFGIARDITERKRIEERIQEQADLLNKAQDSIFVGDLEGRILFCNERTMHLYGLIKEPEEVIGKKVEDLFYKEDSSQVEKAKKTTLEKGEWKGELRRITKDGKEVIVESRWTLVRNSEGKPKSILSINTDITERKKLEAQFLRAQRIESIGTLAGGIAHDLNNILSPIMMALQLLRQRFTDKRSQSWIDTLETSAQRGADLVKQVLSFARGLEDERTSLQVKYLISEIEKIAKETFPRSIKINTDIPKDLWLICGDPTQLHQVLMNLCVNTRDAMPKGGILSISAENLFIDENYARMNIDARVGPYVVITVSDTGVGIAPEIIERIFEPFFTTKEIGKGTGLGLSTAFGIVKNHGGFMHAYSELGKGTRFKVYLPAIETTELQKAREKQIEKLPAGHGEPILVVDDEASIRDITKMTLETYDYRVTTAENGVEALELYTQNRGEIKVVLMDMMMPIMDGPAAIREIRKVNPQIRIIAVSGLKENEEFEEVADAKIDAFLSKPYTAEKLLNTLHEVLNDE